MTMATMHPVVILGSYGLDHDRLPADEFQIRMQEAYKIMDANGWRALFAYGDAMEHRSIAWLTNFVPRLRWAMAMLPREGDPRILISMTPRDMPAMKLSTWIPDVLSGWNWDEGFDKWLADFVEREEDSPVRVGVLGRELMRPPFLETLKTSTGNSVVMEDADDALAPLVRPRRPRELVMVREAARLVDAAAAAMEKAWRGGADGMAAAIEAERAARSQAAHDVRVLFSVDGGRTLLPFYGITEGRGDPMVAYIAVKYMGYWADGFVTFADKPSSALGKAKAALDAVLAAARPGATADVLCRAGTAEGLAPHPVIAGSVGNRIGLSLSEDTPFSPSSGASLEPGGVYTFRVGGSDESGCALLSAMVRVTEDRVDTLRRSA